MNLKPIRKVALGAVAALLTVALQALGVDLGPEVVEQASAALVGFATAYLVKDPRVGPVKSLFERVLDTLAQLAKHGAEIEAEQKAAAALRDE